MRLSLARYDVAECFGVGARSGILLRLVAADGIVAYSELAPLPEPNFSRESLDSATAAFRALGAMPIPESPDTLERLLSMWIPKELPSLRWALEVLLADYAAQRCGIPLAEWYCGATVASALPINALLPRNCSRTQIEAALRSGFECFKLKVGPDSLETVREWIELLAECLPPHAKVRLDANQSFSLTSAIDFCRSLGSRISIEYLEEPLESPTLVDLSRLRTECTYPIALDETLWCNALLAQQACSNSAVRSLILKPCMLGGYFACKRIVEACGPESVTVTSTMEVGPAYLAGIHVALALQQSVNLLSCGFDTLKGYQEVFVPEQFRPNQGFCRINNTPGLGADFSEYASRLDWQLGADWSAISS